MSLHWTDLSINYNGRMQFYPLLLDGIRVRREHKQNRTKTPI